ncbi:hypothetical protein QR680_011616 [Steinernema hermaphroditum]|uniref:Uncharacterized protein n=1 Tax=Steinernema hermaphroditum TaxID=289476 RepID=A0AA39HZ64_9BILA|nr:hypothetical protein QR680_011616 [Steinernema hermaphroditum]
MSVFCLDAPINSFECFEEQCLNDNEQLFGDNEQQFGDNEKQFDDNEQQFGDNEQQFHCLSRDTRTTALWVTTESDRNNDCDHCLCHTDYCVCRRMRLLLHCQKEEEGATGSGRSCP